ncbi:MAG TPA: hypothetical protein VGR45_14415, partial [Stellaceae bacterium]|nr:hypothetical protein [Stellaceae bacterium]
MLDASLKQAYAAACSEHETSVAPALHRIDAALEEAAHGRVISDRLARLQTMRVLLLSGLFDPEFYLDKYPDVRAAGADPLEHFAHHGDAENRQPNRLFYTRYYRKHHMNGLPADGNALQHYIEVGERSGGRPNAAFDPRGYVIANRGFADYVDRPLFHFLKVGREGGQGISAGVPDAALRALDYLDYVIAHGSEHHDLLLEAKREIIDELGIDDG